MPYEGEIEDSHLGKMKFKDAKIKFDGGYQCNKGKQNKIGQGQNTTGFVHPYFL